MREDRNNGSTRFGGTKEEIRGNKGVPSQARLGEATLDVVDSEVADACRGSKELEEAREQRE